MTETTGIRASIAAIVTIGASSIVVIIATTSGPIGIAGTTTGGETGTIVAVAVGMTAVVATGIAGAAIGTIADAAIITITIETIGATATRTSGRQRGGDQSPLFTPGVIDTEAGGLQIVGVVADTEERIDVLIDIVLRCDRA